MIGIIAAIALRAGAPVGTYVGDLPLVSAVRQDGASPVAENEQADVTVIAFTDYRCPICRISHKEMQRAIAKDGRVRIVYKEWPILGQSSRRAARVALAADLQGIYPKVHNALMQSAALDEAALRTAVMQSGGSWERIEHDLRAHQAIIERQLATNNTQAFGLGLGGTPGYLVGQILIRGGATSAEFRRAFAQAREPRAQGR